MFTYEEHLDNLVRHISLVRDACLLLGKRLIAKGKKDMGRILIANGFIHDASKFHGIEWDYLHAGKDVPKDKLDLAIKQHVRTNPHHCEYWGSIERVPEVYLAEMSCDILARAQEFGTDVRKWLAEHGVQKYDIDVKGKAYALLREFIDMLTESHFV